MILQAALMCLALNVYHEARGEKILGQYAVALTTMNRVHEEDKSVCEVVMERKQFSWTTKLVRKTQHGYIIRAAGVPKERYAWEAAVIIAANVLEGRIYDFTNGSTYYHTKYVKPYWDASMIRTKAIGDHVFYKMR